MGSEVTGRIQELKREQGISGRELARRLGKSNSWLMGLFNGKQPYDLKDLEEIADALGTTSDYLLGRGAYAAPEFLPPTVQRRIDQMATAIMRRYNGPRATTAQRRALLRIVDHAWEYVERGMTYWEQELEREPVREPAINTKRDRSDKGRK